HSRRGDLRGTAERGCRSWHRRHHRRCRPRRIRSPRRSSRHRRRSRDVSSVWLLLAIGCEVTGTLSLRASYGLRRWRWLIPVVVSYLVAFVALGLALNAGMPVGVAYGLWTAIGIIVIAFAARLIWRDPLTRRMLAGIGLIVVGVLLVEVS